MLYQTKGIVLHHIRYGDSGLIVHIYTADFGRQTYIINGARKQKGKIRAALFQPLSLLDMHVWHKERSDLQHIREASPATVYRSISSDPAKNAVALFLAELLYRTIREQEANPALFCFLEQALLLFDQIEEGTSRFHLVFLLQLTKHIGICPTNNYTSNYRFFDLLNGVFSEHPPSHAFYADEAVATHLSEILEKGFSGSVLKGVSHTERNHLLDVILQYYQLHLEGMGTLQSLSILRDIFR